MKTKIKVYCNACGGTGLYKGMGEGGKCAVICARCKGSGAVILTFERFKYRKEKRGVKRVFVSSFGYCHIDKDVTTKEGVAIRFSQGGCTYKEWLKGKKPEPVRDLYCPYLWMNNGIGHEPLAECRTECALGGSISKCRHYNDKAKCWEEYEGKKQ